MSERAKSQALIVIGVITCALTVTVQLVNFGDLKGRIQTVINAHEARLSEAEGDVKALQKDVSNIEGRLHGIASQVGRLPGRVSEKITQEVR